MDAKNTPQGVIIASEFTLFSSERQKAITLLRALLMEAVTNQSSVPASGGEREPGNE